MTHSHLKICRCADGCKPEREACTSLQHLSNLHRAIYISLRDGEQQWGGIFLFVLQTESY